MRLVVAPGEGLEAVRDRVRALPAKDKANGVEIVLAPETYALEKPLVLDGRDSGTPEAPIVWCAPEGDARPLLVGGSTLPASSFKMLSDPDLLERLDPEVRGKVLGADISKIRYAWPDVRSNMREVRQVHLPDVYVDGRELALASFPANGWDEMVKVVDNGDRWGDRPIEVAFQKGMLSRDNPRGGAFEYAGDRPSRWLRNPHVLILAFWKFDWFESVIHVKSIDVDRRVITMGFPSQFGVGKGNPAPRRWKAINLFEELTQPGQYCIDFDARMLYVYPPENFSRIEICGTRDPLIRVTGASNVVLKGLHLGRNASTDLVLDNATNITVTKCLFTDSRGAGVSGKGCSKCRIEACDFRRLGMGSVSVEGGDRKTLARADNEIVDCIFEDWNRFRLNSYAVSVGGVGNAMRHCEVRNCSHQAVLFRGNDNVFEFNVVSNVCKGSDDCGAFYMGRDPSERGNEIRWNYFTDIGRRRSGESHGAAAVYLDDATCGSLVFGNVFRDAAVAGRGNFGAVFSHGGYSNVVRNCLFVDCRRPMGTGSWSQERWTAFLQNEENYNIPTKLTKVVDIREPPYTTCYPELIGFLDPHPDEVRWNAAWDNAFIDCNPLDLVRGRWATNETDVVISGNPGFVDRARGDYRLRADSQIYDRIPGFRTIPFEKMGLLTSRGIR